MIEYQRANTDWLAACAVGVSVHWTAQTAPRHGSALPFAGAVSRFRLAEFLGAVERSGADYVIFTAAHALQMLPCPHPVIDAILPGRTTERDLLGEIADGLARLGKRFIVYYNHSCNGAEDPEWEKAVGYHDQNKHRLAENLCAIVKWLGERYGDRFQAWWFDSPYSLDPRGLHNTVTTDMRGFQFPWEAMTAVAKAGLPERLVTYNSGIGATETSFLYTDHQDYWAGELVDLSAPPRGRFLKNGLQWHGWACLDDRQWMYKENRTPPSPPLYTDEELRAFLTICRRNQAPMCFNVIGFQDGTLAEESVEQLHRVKSRMEN